MRIIAIVRTLNEENNIRLFCESYQWADEIIVSDGGSMDRTVEIATEFPNVHLSPFLRHVHGNGGHWRNPHGEHINHMIREAVADGADWIIFDDCDCVPNESLRESARSFLESDEAHSCVMALRIYLWGKDKYFPKLNEPGPSLWAWRPAVRNIRADESNPWEHRMLGIPHGPQCDNLSFPMVLLHYSWPTPEAAAKKVERYRASGQHPDAVAPTEFAGPMAPILPFMTTSLH